MADNVELFDDFAARILARLYEEFPRAMELAPQVIGVSEEPDPWTDGLRRDTEICMATIYRLRDFGLIAGEHAPYGLSQARLTLRGLQVLRGVPESISDEPAGLGRRLADTIASKGPGEAARSIVRSVITEAVRLGSDHL